ncbi:hypothetical protein POX_d04923 [Penicillium oxalicum]|uniref:hypothetical protein n=1 Tax=Penicillium oxalicum TaxID=69781 RepID=UPI0020B8FEAA|nr:hypothetical protein POX_d04923 [Penicillium oxalicum]KAI2789434.1 hypothetical protein POX_d04923 [Penicillium oxalicum]
MVMGQGQQPVVHPFFRKDVVLAGQHSTSLQDASVPPADSVNAHPSHTPPTAAGSTHEHTTQPLLPYVLEYPMTQGSEISGADEDPNASRRKRRKTDRTKKTHQDQPLQAGLTSWLGTENPGWVAPKGVEASESTKQASLKASVSDDRPLRDLNSAEVSNLEGCSSRPRKIVKLNLNGRLLSSPPGSPAEANAPGEDPRRRGRSQASATKLVVLKYSSAHRERISKMMVDIQNPRNRDAMRSSTHTNISKAPARPVNNQKIPTHPFFARKATLQRPNMASGDSCSIADSRLSSANSGERPSTGNDGKPFQFSSKLSAQGFSQRSIKLPSLVHPLWPPQGLVHVRGPSSPPQRHLCSTSSSYDYKKSKSRTILVNDEENALLASTVQARELALHKFGSLEQKKTALRLPERRVASGQGLQGAIESQLSWNLSGHSRPMASTSPVVKKLYLSLPSSTSAFDSGKYETHLWSHKYSPESAADVLQPGREVQMLRDWLFQMKVSAVDIGNQPCESVRHKQKRHKKRKKRKVDNELDGFIVSSGEEASEMDPLSGSDDELAGEVTVAGPKTLIRSGGITSQVQHGREKPRLKNVILISGASGCGKTASVYAAAKELDFEVFEINSGSRRSARDMLEKVGDMTQNHLVQLLNDKDDGLSQPNLQAESGDSRQNKLKGFFKGQPPKKTPQSCADSSPKDSPPEIETKRGREQKQSLILFEEADILFEEDRQFWSGVLTIISQSKRPIIITCNDESLIPVEEISFHAILRYQRPSLEVALDYLLLVAAKEGHILQRDSVNRLYTAGGMDLRRSLIDLNFWCQMGVGSEKGGLDWILPIWPPGANVDENGERLRVLSMNTYKSHMGWFNRDLLMEDEELTKRTETQHNASQWWGIRPRDAEGAADLSTIESMPAESYRSMTKLGQLELLSREADYLEMRSALDILSLGDSIELCEDILDTSSPPITETQRLNYIEAYPLLQADLLPDYSSLKPSITATFESLISLHFRPPIQNLEYASAGAIFNVWAQSTMRHRTPFSNPQALRKTFEPIMRASQSAVSLPGRLAPSFENGIAPITEDIAPYVRAIMSYDGRLQEYRESLYAVLVQDNGGVPEKRKRTTRASRAALEGGSKASTRKERWFPDDMNYIAVQRTGRPEWQQHLYDMGHYHIQPAVDSTGSCSEPLSGEEA